MLLELACHFSLIQLMNRREMHSQYAVCCTDFRCTCVRGPATFPCVRVLNKAWLCWGTYVVSCFPMTSKYSHRARSNEVSCWYYCEFVSDWFLKQRTHPPQHTLHVWNFFQTDFWTVVGTLKRVRRLMPHRLETLIVLFDQVWILLIELSTLSGGSLGSCVDEERSQLCELMWIAGRFEHRLLERTLRLRVISWPRLAEGRLSIYHLYL